MDILSYKILDRESTLLIFDRENTINPKSSLQVMRLGDRGIIHSLMGAGFYRMLESIGLQPFKEMGLRYIYAAVTDSHLDLIRQRMGLVHVEQQGQCRIGINDFNWIVLTEAVKNEISHINCANAQ